MSIFEDKASDIIGQWVQRTGTDIPVLSAIILRDIIAYALFQAASNSRVIKALQGVINAPIIANAYDIQDRNDAESIDFANQVLNEFAQKENNVASLEKPT